MSGGGNPNHDPKNGEFSSGSGLSAAHRAHVEAAHRDMAMVNVPLSKRGGGDLNSQIDKWKRQEEASRKSSAAKGRDAKKEAKSLFAQHGQEMIDKYSPKLGAGVAKTVKDMATWQPEKFIKMVANFKAGK